MPGRLPPANDTEVAQVPGRGSALPQATSMHAETNCRSFEASEAKRAGRDRGGGGRGRNANAAAPRHPDKPSGAGVGRIAKGRQRYASLILCRCLACRQGHVRGWLTRQRPQCAGARAVARAARVARLGVRSKPLPPATARKSLMSCRRPKRVHRDSRGAARWRARERGSVRQSGSPPLCAPTACYNAATRSHGRS